MTIEKSYPLDLVNIRLVPERKLYSETQIINPESAIAVVGKELQQWDREVMAVVNCDMKGVPLNVHFCSVGTVNSSLVSPCDLLKSAILSNASTVLFIHNHPSGDPTPSKDDLLTSEKLKKTYQLMGIKVLDNIVIGKYSYYSMKVQGEYEYSSLTSPQIQHARSKAI